MKEAQVSTPSSARHLPYLDGLRGLLALWVVIGHARGEVEYTVSHRGTMLKALGHIHEHAAVPMFIVLSGFLLTLPLRSEAGRTRWDAFQFIKRRGLRILPVYFAVLAIAIAGIAWLPQLGAASTPRWHEALTTDWVPAFFSHVFLVHTWFPQFKHTFDPPMWSLAVEWQLYMMLPFAVVPLYRKFGFGAAIAAGLAITIAVYVRNIEYGVLTGGFVAGWLAMECSYGDQIAVQMSRGTANALSIAALFASLFVMMFVPDPYMSVLGILFFMVLIVCLMRLHLTGGGPKWANVLGSKPVAYLGWLSYSLYLIHYPVLSALHATLRNAGVSDGARSWAVVIGGPLLAFGAASVIAGTIEHRNWWAAVSGRDLLKGNLRRVLVRSENEA